MNFCEPNKLRTLGGPDSKSHSRKLSPAQQLKTQKRTADFLGIANKLEMT